MLEDLFQVVALRGPAQGLGEITGRLEQSTAMLAKLSGTAEVFDCDGRTLTYDSEDGTRRAGVTLRWRGGGDSPRPTGSGYR